MYCSVTYIMFIVIITTQTMSQSKVTCSACVYNIKLISFNDQMCDWNCLMQRLNPSQTQLVAILY